ncbi:MAG: M23 family metallopeptidase [Rikenellaceae bacterium]
MSTTADEIAQEEDQLLLRQQSYGAIRTILVGFIAVTLINALFSYIFFTPKAYRITAQNMELVASYELLTERINAAQNRLEAIAERDNNIYRSLFGLNPTPLNNRELPYPESNYTHLEGDLYSPLMISAWQSMDILASDIYQQSLSLDKLQELAKGREELSNVIPAIWPIDRTVIRGRIGAYGMRLHPIYKRYIMHKGVDLACATGSNIYATGDAIVEESEQGFRRSGYGQSLLLNHGFGYQTRYAHLSKRLVNIGDTVRRGDIIGLVGSTGGSTGPHLHYEVIVMGKTVNPLNYFNRNMSKEEYQQLMESVQDLNYERIDE